MHAIIELLCYPLTDMALQTQPAVPITWENNGPADNNITINFPNTRHAISVYNPVNKKLPKMQPHMTNKWKERHAKLNLKIG